MKFLNTLTIITAKFLIKMLRFFHRGGTSLPGKIALKINKNILKNISTDIKVIIVTGTNGKTTTSRIISKILTDNHISFFENKSGANLISGVTTIFIENSNIFGKINKEYALIECDEAAFKEVSKHLNIENILVTNLFRDQLDRFGEISHTLNNIVVGIKNSKNAKVCLNADCSLSVSIKDKVENDIIFYGIDTPIGQNTPDGLSDAPYCIKCKTKYSYSYTTYAHLGDFYCRSCGYKRPNRNVSVSKIYELNKNTSVVDVKYNNNNFKTTIALGGAYNIYNAISALALSYSMNLPSKLMNYSLSTFKCGFGRMEKISLNEVDTRIILVKNPTGLNQGLNFLASLDDEFIVTFLLNDRHADGTDISWIWDVNFEKLLNFNKKIVKIFVSGIRKDDMALRLKYANIDISKIEVIENYDLLIDEITSTKYKNINSYILPTYTAMFDIRMKLTKRFKLKKFWE